MTYHLIKLDLPDIFTQKYFYLPHRLDEKRPLKVFEFWSKVQNTYLAVWRDSLRLLQRPITAHLCLNYPMSAYVYISTPTIYSVIISSKQGTFQDLSSRLRSNNSSSSTNLCTTINLIIVKTTRPIIPN